MRRFYVFPLFFFAILIFSQQNTLYFDQQWKPTTKDKAAFSRPMPLPKSGTLELLRDYYYPSGKLQMQGYFQNGIERNYVGDIYWYNEDGSDKSSENYINKTKQKKLSYHFDNGKIWKTVEYGDSLKNGKTIEYKPDGSILGECIYENGSVISGNCGNSYDDTYYQRFNVKTKEREYVSIPQYDGKNRFYTQNYYYKNSLKNAVQLKFKNNRVYEETLFDEAGNILQKIDSLSYFKNTDALKNGKDYRYNTNRSALLDLDSYTEYQSFPFDDVKLRNLAYILLYRGEIHFLEKNPEENLYRETDYRIFEEDGQKYFRLKWSTFDDWDELSEYQDSETQLIPVLDIPAQSKTQLFERLKTKIIINRDLEKKGIREEISFSSLQNTSKNVSYSGTLKTTHDSDLIWVEVKPGAYILIREAGGYVIPQKSGELIFIPNFQSQ